jgi:hypothetical protein
MKLAEIEQQNEQLDKFRKDVITSISLNPINERPHTSMALSRAENEPRQELSQLLRERVTGTKDLRTLFA